MSDFVGAFGFGTVLECLSGLCLIILIILLAFIVVGFIIGLMELYFKFKKAKMKLKQFTDLWVSLVEYDGLTVMLLAPYIFLLFIGFCVNLGLRKRFIK